MRSDLSLPVEMHLRFARKRHDCFCFFLLPTRLYINFYRYNITYSKQVRRTEWITAFAIKANTRGWICDVVLPLERQMIEETPLILLFLFLELEDVIVNAHDDFFTGE